MRAQEFIIKGNVQEAIAPGIDTVASVKKLWQYANRNLIDLTSMASFENEHKKQPYVEDRLVNLLKTADGKPVTIAFDMNGSLEFENNVLYIPIGIMWKYRGIISGPEFVKKVVNFLSNQSGMTEDEPARIKLGAGNATARAWITKVYARYPHTFNNNHVMSWGEGDDQELAMFELEPSMTKRGAVEVKWFQAYPLRQGIGSRAMKELQDMAREDGISLTLFPWDKGRISQAKLMKFYRLAGFKPIARGGKSMAWTPEQPAVAESKQPGKSVTDAILNVMPIAQEIWFHGSRATGSHRKNSDTDILVIVPDDLVGDQYLGAVRILQKLSSHFDNYDIQPTKSGTNIHRIAQEEGRLLWSNKQAVAEVFDQPYKTKTEKSKSGSYDMLAKLPDGTNLSIMFNNEGGNEWQVDFYRNNSQEVTGEGDAQRIFATVLNAIQKFIKKHKPLQLTFSASKETDPTIYYEPDEPQPNPESRAKLYNRLVQRYAAALGYDARSFDHGNQVTYELTQYSSPENPFEGNFHDGKKYVPLRSPLKPGMTEGATVTRIDSKPITDFGSSLKAYKHTDDWSQSGVDTGDDSYWKNKNLKTNTTKGLFAGDPRRTALYATGNAHETRYVEFTQNGQPIVYFDQKDLPAMRSRKTYLTVFDASNFRQLPTGEWFSENPGKPIKQVPIGDPFKYIASQGWIVRVTDDLDKVFNQVKNMHKAGKIAQYGAEGMNESKQGLGESLRVDVPNEEWLNDAIAYAKQKSPDRNGLPYMGKTTAIARPEPMVSMDILKRLPGMRNEQQNVRQADLAAIMKIMNDTGKLPLHDFTNEEYKPFVNVAYDGSAWVNEGNHRIMAAAALGWKELPVQISYFDGGERVESGPMYPGKIGL